ncbi:Crp/Fnr family transcriptional regulator [Marinicrinis sediminis]|uniref:Crp/Fnr family transcriptional regulator n=1 Tax=Marinicrinis sediminis TaxID=1652465 RepID=A0ABW5R9P6_9BACL
MEDQRLLHLAEVPLFSDMSQEELAHLAHIAIDRTYDKKQVIFHEGSEKTAVYLIQTGLVKTYKTDRNGHEQIVNFLSSGSMFPHTGLYAESPYPATAETLVQTKVLAIPIRDFEQLLRSRPSMSIKVMRVMGKIIMELQAKLQDMSGQEVQLRAQSFLIAMVAEQGRKREGTNIEDGIWLPLPITHQEFASTIGTTRESITRLLSQWRKEGLMDTNRDGFIIHDLDAFKRWKP